MARNYQHRAAGESPREILRRFDRLVEPVAQEPGFSDKYEGTVLYYAGEHENVDGPGQQPEWDSEGPGSEGAPGWKTGVALVALSITSLCALIVTGPGTSETPGRTDSPGVSSTPSGVDPTQTPRPEGEEGQPQSTPRPMPTPPGE